MVLLHENIVGIDSAIFMHPTIWKASGHVDAFNDPLIDNRDSKKRYRADVLIEDQIAKYEEKIDKEVAKARKRFGDAFDEAQFRATNARVIEHQQKRDALHQRYSDAMNKMDLAPSQVHATGQTYVSSTLCLKQRLVLLPRVQAPFTSVLKLHKVSL